MLIIICTINIHNVDLDLVEPQHSTDIDQSAVNGGMLAARRPPCTAGEFDMGTDVLGPWGVQPLGSKVA